MAYILLPLLSVIRLSSGDFVRYIAIPCLVYSVFFFGGSEVIEAVFLDKVDESTIHMLHVVRGVFSVFFVAAMVLFSLSRADQRFYSRMESVCSLLNLANEGLIAFDTKWEVVSMNQLAKEMLGSVFAEDFQNWVLQIREQLLVQPQFETATPSGNRNLSVVALQSHEQGLLLLLHDMTEEKKMEERWLIAEKMASVGRMAAGLAHEIGTPLNIISGRAELIQAMESSICNECASKPVCGVQKHIGIIFSQIERISGIIQQLLTQAREPLSRQDYFSLNDCVRTVIEFLEPVAEKKSIDLQIDLDETLPEIYGFRDQFQQVLINLITNSVDAVEGQEGTIKVGTSARMGELILTVTDDGCGIAEVNLTRIFDPFFTTKEFGKGTGLGLTVTSNIIRSHGGTIDVQSKLERGTTIAIHLPADVKTVHTNPVHS